MRNSGPSESRAYSLHPTSSDVPADKEVGDQLPWDDLRTVNPVAEIKRVLLKVRCSKQGTGVISRHEVKGLLQTTLFAVDTGCLQNGLLANPASPDGKA